MENILNIFTKDTDEKIFYRVKNSELEQELSKRHTVTYKGVPAIEVVDHRVKVDVY